MAQTQDSSKDLNVKITMAKSRIERNQAELYKYKPDSKDYKELVKYIKKDKQELSDLQTRLKAVKNKAIAAKKQEDYNKNKSTYEEDFKAAKKDLQIAKDTNGDVKAAEAAVKALEAKAPKALPLFFPKAAADKAAADKAAATKAAADKAAADKAAADKAAAAKATTSSGSGSGSGSGSSGASGVPAKTEEQLKAEALDVAAKDFSLPETIFNNIPTLKKILDLYTKDTKGEWTKDKLRNAILADVWFKANAKEIKARYVQLYNYQELVKTGQAKGTTDYEMQIKKIEANLTKRAAVIGSAAGSDPAAIRKAAENLYITGQSENESFITDFLAASIRPVGGMIGGVGTTNYSGEALNNYKSLLQTARDNGFQISDILPGGANEQQVLSGIASGKIDINRVAQDARTLASQGQPQYVRDMLAQGFNLSQVFQPYRQTMANVLEINDPNQIDLNDPTLRTAITDKGDMNLYDFKKTLRADQRWQYTEQAKSDVSNVALSVLRDFGFQG